MSKQHTRRLVRVQFEPDRFSGTSLADAYEQLSPPKSFSVAPSDNKPKEANLKSTDNSTAKESHQ